MTLPAWTRRRSGRLYDAESLTLFRRLWLVTGNRGEAEELRQHPGIGAYTIVKTGTLTVEDGCGGEVVYPRGSAFIEPAGRVHRASPATSPSKNVQTFLVPAGSGFSVDVPKGCGAPLVVDECKGGGWQAFTYPRTFSDQGDCVTFVLRGED
jgi:hypothetical protein